MAELQKLVSRVRKGIRDNDDEICCNETSPTMAIKMVINNKCKTSSNLERASQNDAVVIVRQSQLLCNN